VLRHRLASMSRPLRPVTPAGIIAARLERAIELAERLDDPGELLDELRSAGALASGLEEYVAECSTPESPALAALAARTRAYDWGQEIVPGTTPALEAEMLSGHVEGQLLKFLVAMTGAQRVLEVGMFTGYSALAIAEALGGGGQVVACEIDPNVAAFAQRGFDTTPDGAKIEIRVGPADETLRTLAEARDAFDLIFIDADKAGYLGYVRAILDTGLLAPGGTICVDNTLLQGEPWLDGVRSANGEAVAEFNDAIALDPRIEQVLVPLRDGVTLIRRI
jgi:caffeoyl-CoA O-methyltransferase